MSQERGIGGRIWDYFKNRVFPEMGDMLAQKTAQGAAELSQALNSQSNAYVPYGTGQHPLEVEGPATSYQQMLREASERSGPEHGQSQEQDRGSAGGYQAMLDAYASQGNVHGESNEKDRGIEH